MADFEVHLSLAGQDRLVGRAWGNRARGKGTVQFEYAHEWLRDPEGFALAPGLPLTRGGFQPPAG